MKRLLILLAAGVMLTSCMQTYHFVQVFEAKAKDESQMKREQGGMLYEDEQCSIFYSFWAKGGDASFAISNKTEKMMFVDLSKSFFIRNGIANDYFQDRMWSVTKTKSYSANEDVATITYIGKAASSLSYARNTTDSRMIDTYGVLRTSAWVNAYATSTSSTEAINERKIVAIPPHTAKIISEYDINSSLFVDCDLTRYPAEKASISFDEQNSPLTFSNYVTYRLGDSEEDIVVKNDFYISQITNYTRPAVFTYVEREQKPCQNVTNDVSDNYSTTYPVKVYDKFYTFDRSNRFYIEYKIITSKTLYTGEKTLYYDELYDGYTANGDEAEQYRRRYLYPQVK